MNAWVVAPLPKKYEADNDPDNAHVEQGAVDGDAGESGLILTDFRGIAARNCRPSLVDAMVTAP